MLRWPSAAGRVADPRRGRRRAADPRPPPRTAAEIGPKGSEDERGPDLCSASATRAASSRPRAACARLGGTALALVDVAELGERRTAEVARLRSARLGRHLLQQLPASRSRRAPTSSAPRWSISSRASSGCSGSRERQPTRVEPLRFTDAPRAAPPCGRPLERLDRLQHRRFDGARATARVAGTPARGGRRGSRRTRRRRRLAASSRRTGRGARSAALGQPFVGDVADQDVLELVLRRRRRSTPRRGARSWRSRPSSATSGSPRRCRGATTAPGQKLEPTTDACWATRFSAMARCRAGSRSAPAGRGHRQAAAASSLFVPTSATMRTVSSRKSGLPAALRKSVSTAEPRGGASPRSVVGQTGALVLAERGKLELHRRGPGATRAASSRPTRVAPSRRAGSEPPRRRPRSEREQLEQRRLRPVEVLEDEHQRPLARRAAGSRVGSPSAAPPAEISVVVYVPRGVVAAPTAFATAAAIVRSSSESSAGRDSSSSPSFCGGRLGVVVVPDPGGASQDLGDRPVRHSLAVREAAPPVHVRLPLERSVSSSSRRLCRCPGGPSTAARRRAARAGRATRASRAPSAPSARPTRGVSAPGRAAPSRRHAPDRHGLGLALRVSGSPSAYSNDRSSRGRSPRRRRSRPRARRPGAGRRCS